MAINFPSNPVNGQIYYDTNSGNRYFYESTAGRWVYAANNEPFPIVADKQILFNNAGGIDGNPGLVFDPSSNTVTANIINVATVRVNGSVIPTGDHSNAHYVVSNAAFDKANSANVLAYETGIGANNYAGAMANASNVFISSVYDITNAAFQAANSEYTFTNAVYAAVNSAFVVINASFGSANTVGGFANTAGSLANQAGVIANSAFGTANTKVASVSGTSGRITSSGGITPTIDLATSGVTASTYGGATQIPVLAIDTYGRVTGASNVAVSGMDYVYVNTSTTAANNYAGAMANASNTFARTIVDANLIVARAYTNTSTTAANNYATATFATITYATAAFAAANAKVASVSGTSGRITSSGGTAPTIDLATAGAGAASYSSGISAITVDAYGRVTSVTGSAGYITSSGVTSITAGTGLSGGTITSTGTISMPNVGPGAGSYSSGISALTLDAQGRVTAITGSAGYATTSQLASYLPLSGGSLTGQLNIGTATKLAFGSQTRQMIDLWSTNYGIGVQGSTTYFRSDSRFSWHRGGVHSDAENNPGTGGTSAMTLDASSNLIAVGSMRSPIFYDSNDTGYYADPAGTTNFWNLAIQGGVASTTLSASYTAAAIEVREYNFGGAQTISWSYAPRISFHWGGRAAAQISMSNTGQISILNETGDAYGTFQCGNFYAPIFYDSNNTAFYIDPASTSVLNAATFAGLHTIDTNGAAFRTGGGNYGVRIFPGGGSSATASILQFTNAAQNAQWGTLSFDGTLGSIGTDSAVPFYIRTNGSNRLTIDGSGNANFSGNLSVTGTGGRTLLATLTAANSPSLSTTALAGYRYIEVIISNLVPVNTSTILQLQWFAGSYLASGYDNYIAIFNGGGSAGYLPTTYVDLSGGGRVSNAANNGYSSRILLHNANQGTGFKQYTIISSGLDSTRNQYNRCWGGGNLNTTTAITGFQVYMSSGNISSGTIQVWGFN